MSRRRNPCCPCPCFRRYEHDKVQKNTFTKWVNYHLETHTSSGQVEDLYEDLRDGVYLCHLIEVLTGEYLPVNKAKVSKRVHHLSNLTNVLTVLRRRGLELINNNPTDLADGNPRIVLGLIWKMILHFQIETNLQLLREGGYEALPTTTYSHPTSALLHPSTSSSSAEALLPKKSQIPKFRSEDLVLRWVQKEISERYGIPIKDMEKSWKDGVAFNALVHRSRPDLVNMEKVKMSSPRENLEQAFELARIHLDIRPLLDVDDMLNEKPDKKSIITYVTQFIRSPALTTRTVTRAPKRPLEHFRSLIEWITVTSADQRISTRVQDDATTSDASRFYTDYEWFCEVRNQFLYRRREFEELRENQQLFAHEEWTTISNNWRRIADRLREWNLYLESDLPEALAIVTHWVSTGEQLIHSPIDVEREHATQSLKILERMMENLELHFKPSPAHREQLYAAVESGRVGDRPVRQELLIPLRVRFDTLLEEFKIRRETLLLIQAHYRILSLLEELETKMERWKTGDSLLFFSQWLDEYHNEEATEPRKKFDLLVHDMKVKIPTESDKLRTEGMLSLQEAESMGEDVLSRFRAMRELLESLIKFWREFETNARRVEEHLTLCEMDNSELKGETKALFKNCERLGDQICIHATGAQPTITARVTKIRQRMEKIRRSPITGYVTNIEVPLPSTSRATSPGHEPTSQLEDPLMKLIKETRLGKWMKKVRVLLSKKISTVKEATTLMNEFVACQKEVAEVEIGRSVDLQGLKDEEKEKINKRYRTVRAEIPTRIDLLKMVHPMLSSVEKYLTEIEAWIIHRDPFSEMGKKTIRERAEIVDQVGFMLDALEKPEFAKIMDCASLRKSYANVKHSFVLPTKTDVAAAIQEVEKLKTRNEAVSQRIDSLKQKFELTAAAPGPNRVEELLERKAAILSRQEDSVEAIKASIIEMNMVNEALILHNATNNQNYTSLQRDWLKKLSHMDRLLLVLGEVDALEKRAQKEKKTLLLRSMLRDADSFIHILNQIELDIPLLEETKRKLAALRQLLAEKHKLSTSVSRSQIGERIKQLEMTPEEDLPIAAVVVKEIVQEAVGLYRKDESEESKQLVEESERVQQLIDRKMDFFRRLQQFYDRIKELQRDNSHWNAITFSKIDSVLSGIDARLKEFHDELKPEEQWLAHELESIEGNFFQLECDRVKEKFRVLIHQMTKQNSLMEKRKEFLTKLQEFNAVLEKTKDTLTRVGRDAQQGLDIRELTNELTDLQSSLQRIGDEVCTTQATAQMNVTDWNIEHAIQQLQQIAIPSTVPETSLHRLVELSQRLGNLLSQSIPKFDTTSPLSISDYIRQLLNLATQEQALVDEIKRSEEQIPASQLDNQVKDLIQTQQKHFHERMSNREVLIDAAVAATIFAIRKDIAGVDKNVDTAIHEKDAPRIQSIEETDWRPVKDRIGELERSLEYDIIEPLKNKWTPHIADLQLIAFNLDGKIRRFRASREKEAKKHAKIVQNLAAFAKWLDLVETDMKNILQNPDLTHSIRESSLIKLKDNLEQHMRLATKLESYPFEDQAQAEFARRQCAKYQELMETLNRLNLPVARLVPIRVETELPSTSAAFGSQLSITSTSSIASEFEKRPEDEARDELGRALETVQNEATRIEIIQEAAQISTRVDEPDKIHELIQTAQAHEVPPPMSDIEQEVQNLINSLKAIRHSYDKLPLKFADQAKEDVDKLKSLTLRANNAEKDLSQFARNVSDRERPRVTRLLSDLQLEHVACERLIDGLIKEIEDELELRINYTQIMSDLTELETEVRDASKSNRTPETVECLDRVEVKLDVLKRQCRRPRRYIASSIEPGERSSSPTRRRRIILKITNTVTTIIKVVEEELRKHSPPPGASTTVYEDIIKSEPEELIELHRTLQRVHKTIEEVISPPCTPTQAVTQKADIDRLIQQAEEIRDSIESLMKHPEQFYSVEQYDMPIRAAQEGRSGLEKVLRQFDESEDPNKVPIGERNRVIDIIHSLLEIEEELEDKKKQSENRSQEYEECIAKIRDNIKDADSLLSQERPSIENVNEIRQQTTQLLQRSEEILREPETALQLRSELELAHDQLNLLDEKIQDKENQLTSTENSIDEAYRLMDIIKNALEQELSDAPFSLKKGINIKNNLEENNQKVQRLKELCNQLEGAPITNILKAAAQEYEDAEGRINNEIESEKHEVENNKGLQEEFDLIENDENGLMVLNIMEESINAKRKEPLERRYIISSTIPFLQNLEEKIKHKRKNIADKLTNNARNMIEELKLMNEIPEEAIERALLQLENLPKDEADVEQLQKELAEVRAKQEQLDSLKRRLNDELNEVAEKLQRVEDSTKLSSDAEKPRKKKGKKQPTVELKPAKRKERIQSLSAAIDQLDNQIIPKMAEIQKEALDNELNVAVLETQQQKATKLVEALNAELVEKEAEQAAIDAVLNDAELLRSAVESIDQHLQVPVTAILSLDEARTELAQANADIDQLKAELRKVEDAQPHGLDQESLAQLKASEELAKSELEKLASRCKELERQAELIGQLEDRKNDAENQVNNLKAEVDSLTEKYSHGPITLVSAEDDLRRSESTKNRLADAAANLNNLKDWLAREIPNNEPAQQQLDEQKDSLEDLNRRLDELRQPLAGQVANELQLLQKQSELENQLAELENQAIQASEPSAFEAIQESLKPVSEQLEQLNNEVAQIPTNLVQHGDLLNLPAVGERIKHLEQVLEQAEDARKAEAEKMALARLAGQISRETAELKATLDRAAHLENDPFSSSADIQAAIDLLDSASTQLGALEDLYNQLDTSNDQQNALRTQAIADQGALGEALGNTRQALQDRLDGLKGFNDGANDIEALLRQAIDQANTVKPEAGSSALEQLAPLANEEAKLGEAISELANNLPALSPLQQPLARHEELQRLHRDLNDQVNKLKNAAEAAVQKQQAIDEFVDNLEKLEEALRSLEREADSAPFTSEALKPLADAVAANLVEPIKQLEQDREAPTDELKERKARLKERTSNLNQRLNNDHKIALNQENLLDLINRDLEATNEQLDQLKAKYQDKQPLDEAIRDKASLEDLVIDKLSPLVATLNDVDDRNKRDEISRRIEETRSNADALSTPLGNEIRSSEELLKDWRDALAESNRIGAEVLNVGVSEDANADLAKATALLDELRPLQQKAEKLESRKLAPTQFIQQAISDDSLEQRVAQLQDELANKRKMLTDKIALESVAPEIQLASETLQKRLDEFAAPAEPLPIETAENSIRELEEQKRRLESLLERIPEGEAGDEIRNKTSWNLNSLRDLLNRLTETVGEKVKAIAAFLASKKEAENQLAQLRDQLNRIEAEGPQSPEALRHQLETLGAEEARLNKLKEQFEEEHRPEDLDEEKRQELEALKREIEAAGEHLKTVRENIQQNIQKAIQLEQLHAEIARVNNDLVSLTEQGRRTLNDAAVIPQTYTSLADQLYEAINTALNLIAEAPTPDAEVVNLQETVSEAQPVHQALATRAAVWEQFVKERDNANIQLDNARKPLDEIEAKGIRSLSEASEDLNLLKDTLSNLLSLNLNLISDLSTQLDPLITPLSESRFISVDFETLENSIETLLNGLNDEIQKEELFNNTDESIRKRLDEIHSAVNNAIEKNSVGDLNVLMEDLDELKAQILQFTSDINEERRHRKHVTVGEYIMIADLEDTLIDIEDRLRAALDEAMRTAARQEALQPDYDIDAAAEVFAAVYPNQHPREVLREHGFDDFELDSQSDLSSIDQRSELGIEAEPQPSYSGAVPSDSNLLSPIPEDPSPSAVQTRAQYLRQRSRWRRILRTALPLQAMLVLLLGAACLVPHCDDEYCCHLLNNSARSFDPSLDFTNGPPPF